MPVLERMDQFNRATCAKLQWVGLAGLLMMMMATTIDVFMAKIFLSPIRGSLDLVELSQLVAISMAGASTLLQGKHVEVDFLTMLLPARVRMVIAVVVHFLCLSLFVLLVWRLAKHGYYLQSGNEVSATVRIPVFPFAYAATLGIIPLVIIYLKRLIDSVREVFGWNR